MGFKSIAPAAVSLVISTSVNAAIIYENGQVNAPNYSGGGFYNAPTYIVYDNFTITDSVIINQIDWYQSDLNWNHTGNVFYIYDGLPESSTLIATDTVVADRTYVGQSIADYTVYHQTVSGLSISLSPGTYYLGMSALGSGQYSAMVGATNSPTPNDVYQNGGGNLGGPYFGSTYFQLSGSVVPIPAAAWLFGSGLLCLIGIARRKKA